MPKSKNESAPPPAADEKTSWTPFTESANWRVQVTGNGKISQATKQYGFYNVPIEVAIAAAIRAWVDHCCDDPDEDGDIGGAITDVLVRPLEMVVLTPLPGATA